MDEAEAIARLRAGDLAGLRELVRLYQVPAVHAAVLILQDRASAEDIVQNAFLKCCERIDQYDDSRPFRPWFLRMVVNDALKAAVKERRSLALSLEDEDAFRHAVEMLDAASHEPEEILRQSELRHEINHALEKLSPHQRAVIILRYFLGFSDGEMAEELHCAPGTVRWHLSTARRRLRALLSAYAEK